MSFIWQCMFDWLSGAERQDFATQLSVLSQRAANSPAPLTLDPALMGDHGPKPEIVLPPVNILCLPQGIEFNIRFKQEPNSKEDILLAI